MKQPSSPSRRESTSVRDKQVHLLHRSILHELGPLAQVVSKSYIYERIRSVTCLSVRTISYILNHTPAP
jgi:hypothetical protein